MVASILHRSYDPHMARQLSIHFLPDLFDPDELCGGIAVVIDVLRASTTITHALAAGAKCVIPCETVEETLRCGAKRAAENVVLAGERDGVSIDGFDLDNSPLNYTHAAVAGRTVLFTTTNGTRALLRSRQAARILIGSFVNINAVLAHLMEDARPIHLVCAGTNGTISAEDCLCAGAIAFGLQAALSQSLTLNDQCRMGMTFFKVRSHDRRLFLQTIRESRGGQNLVQLGFESDIDRAAQWDRFDLLPELTPTSGKITGSQTMRKRWLAEPPDT